jgi:release factor glutamine methyltransferase
MEHGFNQAVSIRQLLVDAGYDAVDTRRDLSGHERLTGGRRP